MIRLSLSWFAVFAMFCLAIYAQEEEHRYNPEQFENEKRAEWQQVDRVIEAMKIKPGMRIADIGGGSGYFARPLAKAVGDEGVVYVCDLATNLMEYLQAEAKQQGLDNLVTVYAAYDRPMLPPDSVDIIFFCNTNHHLEDRVNYYKGLHKPLDEDGSIVVVDWHKREQEVGPPPSHNDSREMVIDEMKQAGWTLAREETFLAYQYFLIFKAE